MITGWWSVQSVWLLTASISVCPFLERFAIHFNVVHCQGIPNHRMTSNKRKFWREQNESLKNLKTGTSPKSLVRLPVWTVRNSTGEQRVEAFYYSIWAVERLHNVVLLFAPERLLKLFSLAASKRRIQMEKLPIQTFDRLNKQIILNFEIQSQV